MLYFHRIVRIFGMLVILILGAEMVSAESQGSPRSNSCLAALGDAEKFMDKWMAQEDASAFVTNPADLDSYNPHWEAGANIAAPGFPKNSTCATNPDGSLTLVFDLRTLGHWNFPVEEDPCDSISLNSPKEEQSVTLVLHMVKQKDRWLANVDPAKTTLFAYVSVKMLRGKLQEAAQNPDCAKAIAKELLELNKLSGEK